MTKLGTSKRRLRAPQRTTRDQTTPGASSPGAPNGAAHDSIGALLKTPPLKLRLRYVAAAIGVLAAGHVVAWLSHGATRVHVSLRTTQIEISPTRDVSLDFSRSLPKQIHVEGLSGAVVDDDAFNDVEAVRMPSDPIPADVDPPSPRPLLVRARSRIVISSDENEKRVRLTWLDKQAREVAVAYSGPLRLRVASDDDSVSGRDVAARRMVVLKTRGAPLDIWITPRIETGCVVCSPMPIAEVGFRRMDLKSHADGQVYEKSSGILAGSIDFVDYKKHREPLRYGDSLDLRFARGELRRLTVTNRFELDAHIEAEVSELRKGDLGYELGIMPTYFDYLRESSLGVMLAGLFASLAGLFNFIHRIGW